MDILKAFSLNNKEIQVNIQGTSEEPLFQANQVGDILGLTNIRVTIKDYDDDEKVVSSTYTLRGMQTTVFLTELGLYRLLGSCRKAIARPFQKWICGVVKELRLNGKYDINKTDSDIDKNLQKCIEREKHLTLINAFSNKNVLYLTKLRQYDEHRRIIKLGWTNDIQNRQRALNTQFGGSTFQDIFECNRNQQLELFLKRHPDIMLNAYRDDIIDNVRSTETYLLDGTQYDAVVSIIKRNIDNYQGFSPEQYIEIEKLKIENKRLDIHKQALDLLSQNRNEMHVVKLIDAITSHNSPIISEAIIDVSHDSKHNVNDGIDTGNHVVNGHDNKPRQNTKNRKIQQYDPQTQCLVNTYDGLMDAVRKCPNLSKNGLKEAATNNTIYHGYRWLFIDRNQENKQYEIPPTKDIISSTPRHIAMLNTTKSEIVNVYSNLILAALAIDSKRKTTISDAIRKGNLVRGQFYFAYFMDCGEELRNKYLSKYKLPVVDVLKGTIVKQIDIKTRQVIKEFASIADVLKSMCISRASLKRACETGEACKGYLWQYK